MATKSSSKEEFVILQLKNTSSSTSDEAFLSVTDVSHWDLSSVLNSSVIRIRCSRDRLIQSSSYFQALLCRSFRESSMKCVSINWDPEGFITILQFIHGHPMQFTSTNFLSLLEGSIYFGIDSICMECESWLCGRSFIEGSGSPEISLDVMAGAWNFSLEHGLTFILESCKAWLAQNFEFAAACCSFHRIPYSFLQSCIEHPQLNVESEKQLCEALVNWIISNSDSSLQPLNPEAGFSEILDKVKIGLLPLGFIVALHRVPGLSQFAARSMGTVFGIINDPSLLINRATSDAGYDDFRIRLTKCTKKLDFSCCPQVTGVLLFLSILKFPCELTDSRDWLWQSLMELKHLRSGRMISQKTLQTNTFEAVHEVDFSKCPRVHFIDIISWLHLSFPSLRILKASYNVHFNLNNMLYLVEKCPLIGEIDMAVDISPIMPLKVSIQSYTADGCQHSYDGRPFKLSGRSVSSNLTRLTLQGRTELRDSDLLAISSVADSVSHLNLNGCISLTDLGISEALCKFKQLSSIVASGTYFGNHSMSCLFSEHPWSSDSNCDPMHSSSLAFRLQQLDLGGCKCIEHISLMKLTERAPNLKDLCLRETAVVDEVLYCFTGCSLEALDISETMISRSGLAYVIGRNPGLSILKATGCRNLSYSHHNLESVRYCPKHHLVGSETGRDILDHELSRICIWKELALGWGFSPSSVEILRSSMGMLRAITVGLGAHLGEFGISSLPEFCPMLESISLCFQTISDSAVRNILQSLEHLQVFELCCCLGELTSSSFNITMPTLKRLNLQWVTPWMTNTDLAMLTKSFRNLNELSLSGCKLLDSESQGVISHGWPGLSLIHLEDCGKITANGVTSLMDCKAVEDLLLYHNGPGIPRNFIINAASKFLLLRKLAVDLCDASDGGFDTPSFADRFSLSTVKILRCKRLSCAFVLPNPAWQRRTVHKETIVLEWNCKELRTSIVKERI